MLHTTVRRYLRNHFDRSRELGVRISATEAVGVVDRTAADRMLWFAVAIAAAADIGTTMTGLRLGLVESNPIGSAVIDLGGIWGMILLKLLVAAVGLVVARAIVRVPDRTIPSSATIVVPTGLAGVWICAVVWNVVLIGIVTT